MKGWRYSRVLFERHALQHCIISYFLPLYSLVQCPPIVIVHAKKGKKGKIYNYFWALKLLECS
jgi:hypothetical protein